MILFMTQRLYFEFIKFGKFVNEEYFGIALVLLLGLTLVSIFMAWDITREYRNININLRTLLDEKQQTNYNLESLICVHQNDLKERRELENELKLKLTQEKTYLKYLREYTEIVDDDLNKLDNVDGNDTDEME